MSDLISRQAAIDIVAFECGKWTGLAKEISKQLKQLPSVQPEIIYCKECMNHGKEICYFWSHFYGTINTPDDGFCHKAERRKDG